MHGGKIKQCLIGFICFTTIKNLGIFKTMIGFIRASSRIFRNRRVMLGSFVALILTYITHLIIYSQITRFDNNSSCFWPVLITLSGLFWPTLWGCIIAGTSPRDEMRQGTLEFLLTTPITPKRLILGMTFAPLMITMVLCFSSIPSILICLFRLEMGFSWISPILVFMLMMPMIWLHLFISVLEGSQFNLQTGYAFSSMFMVFGSVYFFVIAIWGHFNLPFSTWIIFVYAVVNLLINFIKQKKSASFAIEDLEKQCDPKTKTISGLFAFLRRYKGTIFSQDEGISKYMTLEQMRQQTIGGPLTQRQNVRDFTIVILFLLSPFVLLLFIKYEPGIYSVLGIPFVVVLLLCAADTISNAMGEMLNERSSLRLDAIRITLIPLTEITDTRERVASMLSTITVKWVMLFFVIWMVVVDFFQPLSVLVVMVCFIVQAWLVLKLAARLGLLIGFYSKDMLEGNLWVLSSLFAWLGAPYILHLMARSSTNVLIPYIASISPIHALLTISFQPLDISIIMPFMVGLALQYAIFVLISRFNQNKMRYAWR